MSSDSNPNSGRWVAGALVILVCAGLGVLARRPAPDTSEVQSLAAQFKFKQVPVPAAPIPDGISHKVNANGRHLQDYLHQIGASGALGDLDGDGLTNDLCMTDMRAKALRIGPVPGTGDRYPTFTADLGPGFSLTTHYLNACRMFDANEDGYLDLLVLFGGRTPMLLLRRPPTQTFDETGAPLPLVLGAPSTDSWVVQDLVEDEQQIWFNSTGLFTDVDGDGHADIVIGSYFKDGSEILLENSTQPFEMNDGFNNARNGGTNRVFLFKDAVAGAEPAVRYEDVGDVFPEDSEYGWTLAVGAADLDGDGLNDLYVANDFGPDTLLHNRSTPGKVNLVELKGARKFAVATSSVIGLDTFKSMGIDFYDINEDGTYDMYVSNIASDFNMREGHFLWMSTGPATGMANGEVVWEDRAKEAGVDHSAWSWESRFEDFNNDGVMEMVQATGLMRGDESRWADLQQLGAQNDELVKNPHTWPKIMFGSDLDGWKPEPFWAKGASGRYIDLSSVLYPDLVPNSRGIPTGDMDGDGDIDMMFVAHWDDSTVLINESPDVGAFLGLHVLLPVGTGGAPLTTHAGHPAVGEGSDATGAMVTVVRPDGRTVFRQVDGGNGHNGMRAPQPFFGLGEIDPNTQLAVSVRWRDRQGVLQEVNMKLTPGWHTVILGPSTVGANP